MTIFINLLPYITLLLLAFFVPFLTGRKFHITFLFFILFIFAGFRDEVGWDYFNYLLTMEDVGWRIANTEFLMRQLELFCYNHGTPRLFFVVTSFLTVLCYFMTIAKESRNPSASIIAFLCFPVLFLSSLVTIRFSLAVAIVFLSYHFLSNKRYLWYLVLLVAAFFVHKAALFAVFTMPFLVLHISFNLRTNLVILFLSYLFGILFNSFTFFSSIDFTFLNEFGFEDITQGIETYMVESSRGFSRTPYLYALVDIIILLSYNGKAKQNGDDPLGLYITMFNIGCSITFLFTFNPTFASRIGQFFLCFFVLIVPYLKRGSVQQVVIYSILIFVYVYQLVLPGFHPDFIGRVNCWLPYRMNFAL
ncbi:MAG: EpsG family protein [Bacteroidales bacterium]|nr:EpsG family protein [Bacteroidales bacterium]